MEDIGHVSFWSKMYSIKAQIDADFVRCLGMQAENMARYTNAEAMAYNDQCFIEAANRMDNLAMELQKI